MFFMSESEMLFYGGIAIIAVTALLSLLCVEVFTFTGKKIREKIEREYGKIIHKSI